MHLNLKDGCINHKVHILTDIFSYLISLDLIPLNIDLCIFIDIFITCKILISWHWISNFYYRNIVFIRETNINIQESPCNLCLNDIKYLLNMYKIYYI